MSQVRKLLNGNLIPKAEGGYKFKLDSQEYTVTDEQLKEIDDKIALLEPQHRRFLGNWTNAIKSGNSSGNRASNTVTMNMLSGIDGKDIDRLKRQKGSYWETITGKDSYYAKEAINEALGITASVLKRTPAQKEDSSKKTAIENTVINLDFNEKDGKKYLSPTSEQNLKAKKRVTDLLAHLQAGDTSAYDYSAYNTDAISSWLNGQEGEDKYKAASDYFNNLWTTMSKSGYVYDPDVEDLLKMFGINYGLTASTGNIGSAGSTTGNGSIGSGTVSSGAPGVTGASTGNTKVGDIITVLDKDYKVTGFKDNGDPILEEVINTEETENTEGEEVIETAPAQAQNLVLIKPGDRNDMDWGVYYNGKAYSYKSILPGSELGNLMAQFEANNRMLWNQGQRYNANSFIKLPSIKNFADWTLGQTLDDGTDLNEFFLSQGVTSAALNHIATDVQGNRYYKYYKNFDPSGTYIPSGGNALKQTPWGIRSPYYLMIDKDGNIVSLANEPSDAEYGIENTINAAPKFKDLWKPTDSVNLFTPYDNTYKTASSARYNGTVPATFIGIVNINGEQRKLYKLKDGRFYLQHPKHNGRNSFLSPEQLHRMFQNNKYRLKDGGTISKSKTDSFKSKFEDVVKGQNGINGISYNYRVHPWVRDLFTDFNIPENSTIYRDREGQWLNGEKIREGIDWGIKQNGVYIPLGDISPAPMLYPKKEAYQMSANDIFSELYPAYENPELTNYGYTPINEQKAEEELPKSQSQMSIKTEENPSVSSSSVSSQTVGTQKEINPNWRVPGWRVEKSTPSWKQGSLYPEGTESKVGYNTTIPGVLGMNDFDPTNGVTLADIVTGKKTTADIKINGKSEEVDDGGGYVKNVPDYSKHLIPLISMIRFGINAGLQRKYRDTAKKAIEAARFHELPVRLHAPRIDNPALDRALQQIQSERMQGMKPVTSDLIANNALLNQREGQLWDREQSIIGQRSQSDWEAKKEVLNVMNQNQMNEISTANSNRARDASINSALYNPELQYIQRRGQSIENLGLEIQNNIKRDRNIILDYRRQLELQRQTDILNNKLDQLFPNARRAYALLSEDEKLNYTDYTDFLRKTYPDEWVANIDTINKLQDTYTNNLRQWMYENGLNYSYPSFLTGKSSRVGYNKKGGYLRGSTRYTMEPDERIWVENNKATHKAIGKLSDNTIKLLLRALK